MGLPYSKKVIEHFVNPRNVGKIEDADAKATEGSPACGDMVKVYLKVDKKTKVIKDIKFESYGCASNIATASITTEMAKGKTIEEAKKFSWKDAADALDGLPPVKVHCAVLAIDALKTAIENYENKFGLIVNKKPTGVEKVRERLEHVIDPRTGMDVIRTKLVKKIEVKKGIVTMFVDMARDEQFSGNVENELKERIEPLWDVKEVKVVFDKS